MIHLSVGESEEKLDNVVYMPYNLWFKLVNRKLDILSPKSFREVMYTCIIYFADRNTELGLSYLWGLYISWPVVDSGYAAHDITKFAAWE